MVTTSFIIPTWNSADHLPHCLACLAAQTNRDFEVIIVDNASTDGCTLALETKYPNLTIHVKQLSTNIGFAAANNIGAKLAQGSWLALLNADAFVEPNWLSCMLAATQRHPKASFSSCLIKATNHELIDGQGDFYHASGQPWRRNYNLPRTFDPPEDEVFSACAAAAFYPVQAFLAVGGFDEDYFAYHEDVDLGFRLRLYGLNCFYIPEAVAYHVGSASLGKRGELATYLGHRNLVWTFIKDMPGLLFWLFLPIHLAYNVIHLIYFTRFEQGHIIWKAKLDAWKALGSILEKRKIIQKNKTASIKSILSVIRLAPLEPIFNISRRNQSI